MRWVAAFFLSFKQQQLPRPHLLPSVRCDGCVGQLLARRVLVQVRMHPNTSGLLRHGMLWHAVLFLSPQVTVCDEGLCRVGWSTLAASLDLGTDKHRWVGARRA